MQEGHGQTGASSEGPEVARPEHPFHVRRLRDRVGSAWGDLAEGLTAAPRSPWGGGQEFTARLLTVLQGGRLRDNGHELKGEVQAGVRKSFFMLRKGFLGGFPYPTEHCPEQRGLTMQLTLL